MKRAKFTEEQIISVLREHEAGAKAADLARKHGVSEATLYNWKAKFGGMEVSEAKRLRQLGDENAKLKKLLAEQMLDAAALRELLSKKMVGPVAKREAVAHLQALTGSVGAAGLLRSSAMTARWSANGRAGRQTPNYAVQLRELANASRRLRLSPAEPSCCVSIASRRG